MINVWEDNHQQPILPTTTNVADLVETDNQWTEFLYASRGYPGVFASTQERPPVMRFYASVPEWHLHADRQSLSQCPLALLLGNLSHDTGGILLRRDDRSRTENSKSIRWAR